MERRRHQGLFVFRIEIQFSFVMESVGFQSSLEKSDVFSKFFLEELRHCALRIVLRLDIYTPSGALLETVEKTIGVEYIVPNVENSVVTVTGVGEIQNNGTWTLNAGETLLLTVDTLAFAAPDVDVAWYVGSVMVSENRTYLFQPDRGGEYTISVRVNGELIGDGVVINVDGPTGELPTEAVIAICVCVGVLILAVAVVAFGVGRRAGKKSRSETPD